MLKYFFYVPVFTSSLFSYLIIYHEPIKYFMPNYRIKILAKVEEFDSVFDESKIKFRVANKDESKEFYIANMDCGKNKVCIGTIPAPLQTSDSIEYYIEAIDKAGHGFRTTRFTIPKVKLPPWQKIPNQSNDNDDETKTKPSNLYSNIASNSFSDRSKINYIDEKDNIDKQNIDNIESNLSKLKTLELNKNEQKTNHDVVLDASVDFTGIWSVKRTLSSCSKELYAYKVIRLISENGVIIDSKTFSGGTTFAYSQEQGYFCRLVDDSSNSSLVGEKSIFSSKQDFLKKLQEAIGRFERIELIEFSKNKIIFNLYTDSKVLTTIYTRETSSQFFKNK